MKLEAIEKQAVQLSSLLQQSLSDRLKLFLIVDLLFPLIDMDAGQRMQSYFLEWFAPLMSVMTNGAFEFCDPDYLLKIDKILDHYHVYYNNEIDSEILKKKSYQIRLAIMSAYYRAADDQGMRQWSEGLSENEIREIQNKTQCQFESLTSEKTHLVLVERSDHGAFKNITLGHMTEVQLNVKSLNAAASHDVIHVKMDSPPIHKSNKR